MADEGLKSRDGHGKYTHTLESAQRDLEACRLRARGWTLQQIADEFYNGHRGNAWRQIRKALAEVPAPGVEEYRKLQLDQLDYLKAKLVDVLDADHPMITQAGKIAIDVDGNPVDDPTPVIQAVGAYRQLLEREAKLVGSDAPQQRVVTIDDLHAERARLLAEDDEEDELDDDFDEDDVEREGDEA